MGFILRPNVLYYTSISANFFLRICWPVYHERSILCFGHRTNTVIYPVRCLSLKVTANCGYYWALLEVCTVYVFSLWPLVAEIVYSGFIFEDQLQRAVQLGFLLFPETSICFLSCIDLLKVIWNSTAIVIPTSVLFTHLCLLRMQLETGYILSPLVITSSGL